MSHIFKKGLNSQSHIRKKGVQFFESREKVFNSLSHIRKKRFKSVSRIQKGQWCESYPKKVQWCESFKKKVHIFFEKKICESRLKYLKHIEKSSNNWIIFKKGSILWVCSLKKSNSLRHMEKRFNSLSHILKTVQFFELYFLNEQWFNSMSHGSNSMSQCWKEGFNFYESMLKRRVQFLWVMLKRGFNTVSHVEQHERFNSLSHVEQKGSILRVICWKGFSS